jgi:hypothetical protein
MFLLPEKGIFKFRLGNISTEGLEMAEKFIAVKAHLRRASTDLIFPIEVIDKLATEHDGLTKLIESNLPKGFIKEARLSPNNFVFRNHK